MKKEKKRKTRADEVDEILERKEEKDEEAASWDIKRIFIGIIILAIIIFLVYTMGLPLLKKQIQMVISAVSEKSTSFDQKKALDEANAQTGKLLERAKSSLSNLTEENISSNASQLQKIIQDLQAIQQRTKQPIDVICDYVCRK